MTIQEIEKRYEGVEPIEAIATYLQELEDREGEAYDPLRCKDRQKCVDAGYWPLWCLHCPPVWWT